MGDFGKIDAAEYAHNKMTPKRVESLETAVAYWLATKPGTFTSRDAVGLYERALAQFSQWSDWSDTRDSFEIALARLGYLREAWSTPLVYLNRMTLLSQDRATAQAVLSGAGAYTLNLAAAEAIRKGNLPLAMAVCAATENLNKEQSGLMRYSREEIAASVGFKDFFDATEALEMTGLELATAELDGRELVGVTVRSEERMALGNRKIEVAKSLGKTVEALEGKTDG